MHIPGLTLIAESINDSVPSTHALFETEDMGGIIELARLQAEKGADYIDVNVGYRSPGFMATVVQKIQEYITLPLSIDTPDPEIAAAGLAVYDPGRAGNRKPILNSISEARLEMFDLYAQYPFIPILLATEGKDSLGGIKMNLSAEETYATAQSIMQTARERIPSVRNDELIIDAGIMPIGSDSSGNFRRLMETLRLMHEESDFTGVNRSVGLSNFTVMLPAQKGDGSPVKGPLESAFLTMAMPLGLNMIVGSVKRKYMILPQDHPAMQCLQDALKLEGLDVIMRVMSYIA